MRKLRTTGICVLLALLAAAAVWYAHDRRGGAMLRQAEALMGTNPDSARLVLEQYAPARHLRGEHQARYALLLTQARYKTYQPTDNDSLIRIAVDYYAHSSDSLRKAWSSFYAGQVYRDLNEPQTAVRYFHQAATAGEGKADERFLYLLYYHWGSLLQTEISCDESIRLLRKAQNYADNLHLYSYQVSILGSLGWSYMYKKAYPIARLYLDKAIQLAQSEKKTNDLSWLYQRKSMSFRMEEKYDSALVWINRCLSIPDDSLALKPAPSTKGHILIGLQQYDSAEYYINRSYREQNLYTKANFYSAKSEIAEGRNDLSTALLHQQQYSRLLDSIHRTESSIALMELQKKYDYSRAENENLRLKAKSRKLTLAFLTAILFSTVAVSLCFFLVRLIKRSKKRLLLQTEKLARQHEVKYSDLQALLKEYSKREIDLQDSIHQSKKQMEHYVRQQDYLKGRFFADCDIRPLLKQRTALLETASATKATALILSADETSRLQITVDALYNNLASRLQLTYGLGDTDLHICCLIKLGIPNSHICHLLNVSKDALKKRAQRLCKNKFKTDLRLEEFIASFH